MSLVTWSNAFYIQERSYNMTSNTSVYNLYVKIELETNKCEILLQSQDTLIWGRSKYINTIL